MTLFPKPFTVRRATRTLVRGVWTDGTPSDSTHYGSIQPLSGKDLEMFPPASRTTGKVWIYTDSTLSTRTEGSTVPADIVLFKGSKYEVIPWQAWDNDLIPHNKYLAEYVGGA